MAFDTEAHFRNAPAPLTFKTADEMAQHIIDSPCTSRWLRDALVGALKLDPVDAANDTETLARVMARKLLNR